MISDGVERALRAMEEGTQSFFLINRGVEADDDNDEQDGFTSGPYMKASAVRNSMKARIAERILFRRKSFLDLKNPDEEAVAGRMCFFEGPEAEEEESFIELVLEGLTARAGPRPDVAAEADL
jgi:hypothetical protein